MNILKLLILPILVIFIQTNAQILQPAKWKYAVSNKEAKTREQVDLIFNVKIQDDWYLFSSDFDPKLGPMVTEFSFTEHESYELIGGIKAINAKKKYDELWEGEYTYFSKIGQFVQTIKILKENPILKGKYAYQVCTDIEGKCIPFDDEFDFSRFFNKQAVEKTNEVVFSEDTSLSQEDGLLFTRNSNDPYSLWGFMIIAFLAGLAAIFTPCVFPMIPMTVTFFTGSDGKKNQGKWKAMLYGLAIILIYTIIGSLIAPFMGPETANELATGWVSNIIFFTIFLIFALSFLGLFEITLPSNLVNKVDKQADKGGLIGVFFMAFTLVLVSFSCTGPLVGTILVESAGGQFLKPILGMFAFSLAFALPFTLFALFPGWLNNLPKSGGWLNSVKVVLGFLELALAFKFLSIADQAYHWHILDREIYLAIWIVIFTLLGFYLLGKIQLSHDSTAKFTSVPKLIFAMIVFTFVIYLIPGMFGAPLKILAGYLPPVSTHDFDLPQIIRETGGLSKKKTLCKEPKYADFLYFPHSIQGYFDYEQADSCAKKQNKPLFIDFTGHGCVNCREMEARVWSDPKVLKRLKENFVMVALYVDDKTELPKSDWYKSKYDGKIKKSIGKQNIDFQINRFKNNAQPYYVILDNAGKILVKPTAYNLDVNSFVEFLDAAVEEYKKR